MNFTTRISAVLITPPLLFMMACSRPREVSFRGIHDFEIQPKSFTQSVISFKAGVYNPNKYSVYVKNVDANVLINGKKVGTYQMDSTMVLPGADSVQLPVALEVSNGSLLSNMLTVLNGDTVAYTLEGNLKAGRKMIMAVIPFRYNGHFTRNDFR